MKIFVGSDHRGYFFKRNIIKILNLQGCEVVDFGIHDKSSSCDYPRIAYKVASEVVKSKGSRGILICMTGIGQAMAANKVHGAYAALCCNAEVTAYSRQHNNANILVLASKFVKQKELPKIINIWLTTKFEGGRHLRRVNQIKKIEKGLGLK